MQFRYAAVIMLALPISVEAQQPPAAPPANPILTAFRGRTLALQRNLAQAFDSIPEAKFSYKPTASQLTIGTIAQHLANDNYLFCNGFGTMKGTRAAEDTTTADSVKAKWPKAKLVAQLKESFAFCEKALDQLDDTKLSEQTELRFGGNARQVSRAALVLGHALDMADHYSQIANYMRLNNMLPPTALPRPRPAGGGAE